MSDETDTTSERPVSTPASRELLNKIIENKIRIERERQIELGHDQHHDDAHGIDHLAAQAHEYRCKGQYVESLALWRAYDEAVARRLGIIKREIWRQFRGSSES